MKAAPQFPAGSASAAPVLLWMATRWPSAALCLRQGGEGGSGHKEGCPQPSPMASQGVAGTTSRASTPQGVVIALWTPPSPLSARGDASTRPTRCGPEHFLQRSGQTWQRSSLGHGICPCANGQPRFRGRRTARPPWPKPAAGERRLAVAHPSVIATVPAPSMDARDNCRASTWVGGPYAKSSGPLLIRSEGVVAKLGVTPEEVWDLKALNRDGQRQTSPRQGGWAQDAITLLTAPPQPRWHLRGLDRTKVPSKQSSKTDREKRPMLAACSPRS